MKYESGEYCDGKVHAKKVTVQYRYKGRLVIIENVRGVPALWREIL